MTTVKEREDDWKNMTVEEWKKKWMTEDGGYIIPDDCKNAIMELCKGNEKG